MRFLCGTGPSSSEKRTKSHAKSNGHLIPFNNWFYLFMAKLTFNLFIIILFTKQHLDCNNSLFGINIFGGFQNKKTSDSLVNSSKNHVNPNNQILLPISKRKGERLKLNHQTTLLEIFDARLNYENINNPLNAKSHAKLLQKIQPILSITIDHKDQQHMHVIIVYMLYPISPPLSLVK